MNTNSGKFPGETSTIFVVAPPGVRLRNARDEDLPFLRELYEHARSAELAGVPWPQDVRSRFLDDQFRLQHQHYVTHFSRADFLLLERDDRLIGRFYIDASGDDLHVIDISLLAEERGRGVGTQLLRSLMSHASREGRGVFLNVNRFNPDAERLYRRLGFAHLTPEGVDAGNDMYLPMRWIS